MMGFNPTFYAGRPKLSEVTIDSDLNMGGRDISDVDTMRAARVYSPYTTETWPTETLDWGDVAASDPVAIPGHAGVPYTGATVNLWTNNTGAPRIFKLKVTPKASGYALKSGADVSVEGVTIDTLPYLALNQSYEIGPFPLDVGRSITITGFPDDPAGAVYLDRELTDTGIYAGGKTFDLSGKWLALGLDMEGLAATVKIQGVEMPYSDYAKYFPLAPTELTIPGNWEPSQTRPVLEVYL